MSSGCKEVVANEGDWVILTRISDEVLVASFRCSEKLCRKMLERKIVLFYNESVEDVKVKVKRGKR